MKMSAAAEKIRELLKKALIFLGAVMGGILMAAGIAGKKIKNKAENEKSARGDFIDEINGKAEKKRSEACERIASCSARDVAESYGAVCDAIYEGKARFRKRSETACKSED